MQSASQSSQSLQEPSNEWANTNKSEEQRMIMKYDQVCEFLIGDEVIGHNDVPKSFQSATVRN